MTNLRDKIAQYLDEKFPAYDVALAAMEETDDETK